MLAFSLVELYAGGGGGEEKNARGVSLFNVYQLQVTECKYLQNLPNTEETRLIIYVQVDGDVREVKSTESASMMINAESNVSKKEFRCNKQRGKVIIRSDKSYIENYSYSTFAVKETTSLIRRGFCAAVSL